MNKKSSNVSNLAFAFALVTILFFLWGFCHAMLDVLNRHFQKILDVPQGKSFYVQFVTYMGYFLMAIPAGLCLKRFGYKGGILIGLGLVAVGAFSFIPAAQIHMSKDGHFWAFLAALFVLFCGLACLETAANPYITILGSKDTASSRLVLSQSFNAVGWVFGPAVGGLLLFGNQSKAQGVEAVVKAVGTFDSLLRPYMVLGSIVAVIFVIFWFMNLPEGGAEADPACEAGDAGNSDPATVAEAERTVGMEHYKAEGESKSLFMKPHFTMGVLAQFCYVAAQTVIGATAVNYLVEHCKPLLVHNIQPLLGSGILSAVYTKAPNIDQAASFMVTVGMAFFAIGRFSGSALLRVFPPHKLLATYAAIAVALLIPVITGIDYCWACLILSFLFLSIMFPSIFAMSIRDLGPQTKTAGSALVMSIVGGAIVPLVNGMVVVQHYGTGPGYIAAAVCLLYVAAYGVMYPSLVGKEALKTPVQLPAH